MSNDNNPFSQSVNDSANGQSLINSQTLIDSSRPTLDHLTTNFNKNVNNTPSANYPAMPDPLTLAQQASVSTTGAGDGNLTGFDLTSPSSAVPNQINNPNLVAMTTADQTANLTSNNPVVTPANPFQAIPSKKKPKKIKKLGSLLKKNKKEDSPATPTTPLFSANNSEFSNGSDPSAININQTLTDGNDNNLTPANPSLDGLTNTDSNPISDSLAKAAEAVDNTASQVSKPVNQPQQLTVSVLTIVFGLLFISTAIFTLFTCLDKNKIENKLRDATAELQSYKDKDTNKANYSNKASAQFDSLQNKIKDLTKSNEDKQKTLDENKKTIEDINKKNNDLSKQLKDSQDKLASDKQVSTSMKSLVTALCAAQSNGLASSTVCTDQAANQQPAENH